MLIRNYQMTIALCILRKDLSTEISFSKGNLFGLNDLFRGLQDFLVFMEFRHEQHLDTNKLTWGPAHNFFKEDENFECALVQLQGLRMVSVTQSLQNIKSRFHYIH